MASSVTTVITARDNYTAVIKKARTYTSIFQKEVKTMTVSIDKVATHVSHFNSQLKPVENTLKKLSMKDWTINLKIKEGVFSAISKIGSSIKKVVKAAGPVGNTLFSAGRYAINKGMEMESYDMSVGHFVGVNNPNASKDDISKKTNGYLDWLHTNAKDTPFDTGDVMQAGTKAVQMTQGNTQAAQGLVKMAENMAALVPSKTIMDAMEAMENALKGDFEGMEAFGFKTSSKEFKKAGNDLFYTKSTNGMTMPQMFGGGTEKLSNSGEGLLSTITGKLESGVQDAGRDMVEQIKPFLESMMPLVDELIPKIRAAGAWIAQMIPKIAQYLKEVYIWVNDKVTKAIAWLSEKLQRAKPFIDFVGKALVNLGKDSNGILSGLGKAFDWVFNAVIDSLNWISENWKLIEPTITTIATLVGTFILLSSAVETVAAAAAIFNAVMAANPVTLICLAISALIAIIVLLVTHWDALKAAAVGTWNQICKEWQNAAAWFDSTVIQPIIGFFSGLWENIKTAASGAWDGIVAVWTAVSAWFNDSVVMPVTGFFAGLWESIKTAASGAWDGIVAVWTAVSTWFNDSVVVPITGFFAGLWESIKIAASGAWDAIVVVWTAVSTWFNDSVVVPVTGFFTGLWESIKIAASGAWDAIVVVWTAVSTWFNDSVVVPVTGFFTGLWEGIKTAASGAWDGIVVVWTAVSTWFNDSVVVPVTGFFTGLWEGIKTAASGAWDGIAVVWTAVSTWFNDSVVVPVTGFFTGLWEGIKTAASGAWDGIKVIWEGAVTFFQTSIVDPVVASFSSIWAGITGAFQDVSTWFEENVFGPIRSVVPGWLLNLFGGGASATVTVVDNRNQPGPGSTDGGTDKPAAGIKRVPFDNYPALLHKGETVLPSGEAGEYRRQGNMSGKAANNISLNITVNGGNMDEERLASILVNRLQEAALNMA